MLIVVMNLFVLFGRPPHPFSTAGERIMENTSSSGLKLIYLLLIYKKNHLSAHARLLWIRLPASDWEYP